MYGDNIWALGLPCVRVPLSVELPVMNTTATTIWRKEFTIFYLQLHERKVSLGWTARSFYAMLLCEPAFYLNMVS